MRIGPSQRVRRAGEVRCAQTTDGSAARIVSTSKASVGLGDVEPSLAALGLPSSLEIQRERVDVAEVLDRLARRIGAPAHRGRARGRRRPRP